MVINSVDFEQQSFFGRRTADGRRRTACNVDLLLGARVRFPIGPNFSVALSKRCLPDFFGDEDSKLFTPGLCVFEVLDTTCDRLVS